MLALCEPSFLIECFLLQASSGESLHNRGSPGLQENGSAYRLSGETFERESDWTKLNRMGKALCSRGRDLDLFSSTDSSTTNYSHRNHDSGYSSNNSYRRGDFNYRDSPKRCQTPPQPQQSGLYPRYANRDFDTGSNGSSGSSCGTGVWARRNASRNGGGGVAHFPTRVYRNPTIEEAAHFPKISANSANFFEPEYLQPQKPSSGASSTVATPATTSPDLDSMMLMSGSGRADVRQLGNAMPNWRPPVSRPTPPPQPVQPPAVITYAERPTPVDENKETAKAVVRHHSTLYAC